MREGVKRETGWETEAEFSKEISEKIWTDGECEQKLNQDLNSVCTKCKKFWRRGAKRQASSVASYGEEEYEDRNFRLCISFTEVPKPYPVKIFQTSPCIWSF